MLKMHEQSQKLMTMSMQELSLAFLCLKGELRQCPKELRHLSKQEWLQLASLLVSLELEKELSQVH